MIRVEVEVELLGAGEDSARDVVAANDIGSVVVVEIDVVELDGVEGDRMSARFGPYGFAVIGSIA